MLTIVARYRESWISIFKGNCVRQSKRTFCQTAGAHQEPAPFSFGIIRSGTTSCKAERMNSKWNESCCYVPLSLGWKSLRSLPRASLKARTSCVRATMSSCSTRWLSELLPSELTLASETDREPDAEPTPPLRPDDGAPPGWLPLAGPADVAVIVEEEDSIVVVTWSSSTPLLPLLIKCVWTVGTCHTHIQNQHFNSTYFLKRGGGHFSHTYTLGVFAFFLWGFVFCSTCGFKHPTYESRLSPFR